MSYKNKEIKNTESMLNDRLLDFIIEENGIENIIDDLDLDMDRPALDSWVVNDYRKLNGNTYIDEFLDMYSHTLSPLEMEILNQKSISHISMFEMVKISGSKIYIEDRLDDNKSYTITDESISNVLLEGDYILARIAKIRGGYHFIDDVEYVPSSITDILYESIIIFFNRERIQDPNLEIKTYLKKYSLDIYYIYRDCLENHLDETDEDIPTVISDIAEFQGYAIENFPKEYHIYMTNLMEIFEYSLMDMNLSLHDINMIDIPEFFRDGVRDGFIKSKEDYNSYINTLKAYLIYLGPSNPEYKTTYNQVIEISKNRFKYMDKLKNDNFDYDYDRMLVSTINNRLSNDALDFVGDLDRFLIFVMEFEIELTEKRKEIRKNELLSINKLLKLSQPFLNSRPNQKDSRIIDLLYNLTLALNLTRIVDNSMVITEKGKNFFKLRDEEKFAIGLSYIWNKDFLPIKLKDDVIDRFLDLEYDSLEELMEHITKTDTKKVVLTTGFIRYLILIGIVEFNKEFQIGFTSLGNLIYRYMLSIKDKGTRVISLQAYKERKTEEG